MLYAVKFHFVERDDDLEREGDRESIYEGFSIGESPIKHLMVKLKMSLSKLC